MAIDGDLPEGASPPTLEWLATAASRIYSARYQHWLQTSAGRRASHAFSDDDGENPISDAIEVALALWIEAASVLDERHNGSVDVG